ncbi:uncharacterized protein MELLADRAFT_86052 [Melampsora larici-populina 98AG31]|uniref:Uncharacterized protein n=1 Tax=Melampsora larici-populina (strain 98AG31 / pathotype 3-4-7) TaxID=747676 RepID=F4RKL2_MELLP|nr:uncharacterized protein MELLADRAFT_86052 [Melampsora larici-populina 98AG31]EGG07159.1 hypothetical protein MELLADRAFT_86052 [Melampsora larici-populina 98AG31]
MAQPASQKRKMPQRVTCNTKKSKPAPVPPSSRAKRSTKPTTKRSTNHQQPPAETNSSTSSDESDDSDSSEDENAWEDQDEDDHDDPATGAQPQTQTRQPHSNARLKHEITLENYQDLDLDIYTINELLSATGRKTRNHIPSDIQKELKNLQFMYRRAKKMLALAAKCSEKTVNEFLEYQNETKLLSKLSEV